MPGVRACVTCPNARSWSELQRWAHTVARLVSLRTHANRDRVINAGSGPMEEPAQEFGRLWRVRRRHDHIDALLRQRGEICDLRFTRNDRVKRRSQISPRWRSSASM